jgi:hypothetical protein
VSPMARLKLVIHRDDGSAVPPTWAREFQRIEERIKASDGDALEARWECGRKLLAERHGKKLPKGLLDNIREEIGVSRSELQYRIQFAEKYSTGEQLSNAIRQYPSWYRMVKEGLRQSVRSKRPVRPPERTKIRLLLREFRKAIHAVHRADLTEADLKTLDAIWDELARINDERGIKQ